MAQRDDEELEQRHDIGTSLSLKAWLIIVLAGFVLIMALLFGLKGFLAGEDPVTRYEKQLEMEEQQ